jgi:hypothetical protein
LLVGARRRRVTDRGVEEAGRQPGAEEEADPSVGVVDRASQMRSGLGRRR